MTGVFNDDNTITLSNGRVMPTTEFFDYFRENIDSGNFFECRFVDFTTGAFKFKVGTTFNNYSGLLLSLDSNNKYKPQLIELLRYELVRSGMKQKDIDKIKALGVQVRVSTESQGMGIYKSFNYEIFERRPSAVIAFDGNSAAANLIQEAKNGKGRSAIFVWSHSKTLQQKARSLHGYVYSFDEKEPLRDQVRKLLSEQIDVSL